ncbi:mitogen-activated protein kinase kinase kinase 7-interacting protein 3 homolog isoform X11 [Macrobrachium rosenbergii]|uniref:mitogen-activated protein kinase kinase kinase 7-interacting protein 3 homolog isoform X11 n=1 Tax=Macrobrachium rosenbergii TaxID=79674 RepID=UPI0034D7811F
MESTRPPADTRNIPHMQLFHHLKQKFPDLRDNDVNESIQKYGLDRERCEEELSQKALIHHGGYYRPWSRPGSSLSSPTLSRVTSPIRTGIPSTPTTPVITTTMPTTPFHHTTATQHVCGPVQSNGYLVYSYAPEMVAEPGPVYTAACQTPVTTNPVFYQPVINNTPLYGWHPSASNGFRAAGIQPPRPGVIPYNIEDTPFSSREPSQSRSVTPVPNSAPVMPSFDPFSAFEKKEPMRRRSAETHLDGRKGQYYSKQSSENFCASPHSPTPPISNSAMDSPATSTTTTTTFTNTRSHNVDAVNINGGNTNRPPPAIVQEQSIRKQKLETELAKQLEEKGKLQSEVQMMMRELEARENQRKRNADSNAKRIEEVQRENQRLQSECDEMENKILRLAPDIGQDDYSGIPSSQPYHEPPVAPQLTRASSGSSLGSGTGTPQTPHTPYTPQGGYIPPRPAAPPPPPPMPNFRGFQGVPGDTGDEMAPKWGCTKCTFINHPDMNKCEMCECPRFTIGTASSHHAGLPPHHQGPCYCHRQHAPGAVASSIGAAAANSLHHTYSSLPLVANEKPSLSNILKEKLIGLRDRSDSV